MSEEKPSAEIIQGPWKRKSSGPTKEELIIVDQLAITDEIVNECSMAYLEILAKNGIDIGDKDFMRHITVLTEVFKSGILSTFGLKHVVQPMVDIISCVENDPDGTPHFSVDLNDVDDMVKSYYTVMEDDNDIS
mgnify:CR=1 FL=1|jgi:hypothetical protein